jgi:hypothetical protein
MNARTPALLAALLALPCSSAFAQEGAAPPAAQPQAEAPAAPPSAEATPATPPHPDAGAIQLTVPWSGPTGKGFSLGIEEGAWGGAFGTGVRGQIPLGRYFGITLRAAYVFGNAPVGTTPATFPTQHLGGRIDFVGKSPVFLNLVRLYGGGGVEMFSAVGAGADHSPHFSGGGHFGFEFFASKWSSFYLEVGGHAPIDPGMPAGQTLIVGMMFYPFST